MKMYPLSYLNLFSVLDADPLKCRAALRAATGQEAPPCREAQVKTFVCPVGTYQFVDGQGVYHPQTIGVDVAGALNLPGLPRYATRTIANTAAVLQDPAGIGHPFNPVLLSLESECDALIAELGYGTKVENQGGGGWKYTYPTDEPRRIWMIEAGGNLFFIVGQLLGGVLSDGSSAPAGRCTKGISYPGSWDVTDRTHPKWADATLISMPSNPAFQAPMPVPARALLPNEKIVSLAGMGAVVEVDEAPAPAAGGLTAEEHQWLSDMKQWTVNHP